MQTELGQYATDGGIEIDYEPNNDEPDYWERLYGEIDFAEAMSHSEPVIEQMEEEFDEGAGWASATDINRVWTAIQEDVETMVEEYNERNRSGRGRSNVHIRLPNERLAVLWIAEITGQISDGAWENYLSEHQWQALCYATIEVDEDLEEAESEGRHKNLGYVRKLREHAGHEERMMYFVRAAGLDDEYDHSDLLHDLQDLKGINN